MNLLDLQTLAVKLARRLGLGAQVDRWRGSPLAQRLATGTFWSMLGALASRAATLVGTMLAARILGREVFGQYSIVQSTVSMFLVLASFGMSVTATKYVAQHRERDKAKTGGIISACSRVAWITGLAMTLALVLLAPWLARTTLAAPELAGELRLAAIALLLGALGAGQSGALSGLEAFRAMAVASTRANVCGLVCLVAGAWWFGLPGAVLTLGVVAGLTWLFQRMALARAAREAAIPLRGRLPVDWRMLWHFSLPAVLGGLMTVPVNWICNAWLVNRPQGYVEMGAYNAASQYLTALLFIPIVLSQTMLPMLSERFGAQDRQRSVKLMMLSVRVNALAAWPAAVLGCLISPWLMRLYGVSFVDAWPTLVVSLLTGAVLAVQVPMGQVLAASGRMWAGFMLNTAWAVAFLVFTYLLVDRGAFGLALARLLTYVLHAGWTLLYAIRLLRQHTTPLPAPIPPAIETP